ncbi:fimbrial protein [Salmonella enterica subsp. enterica serovar Newport]|nr:fimbrial protein [Salmonella enterica subsp. enterica serovar Newport]EEB0062230.1 fimbrial protein [Salmonella enterica subsp. enterica serovar Brandenburg]EJU6055413.1 fimbrial protein [Salmonella enterica]EAC0347607.1 fimbrial protein [Salmonella enterica subsp. enterica serovar Newport]EBF8364335.1 fimbrial protein [Salmonella enterica subsp. enterica serovar Newport]
MKTNKQGCSSSNKNPVLGVSVAEIKDIVCVMSFGDVRLGALTVMRFNKIKNAAITIGFALFGLTSSVHAADPATASLIIEAILTKPTCMITVPTTYDLGQLIRGQVREHEPLLINVNCPGKDSLKTALKAKVIAGRLEGDDKVQMLVNGQGNGTLLSLKPVNESGASSPVKLTGAASGTFCEVDTVGYRQCQLIPVTEVHSEDTPGHASATLLFEVVYP